MVDSSIHLHRLASSTNATTRHKAMHGHTQTTNTEEDISIVYMVYIGVSITSFNWIRSLSDVILSLCYCLWTTLSWADLIVCWLTVRLVSDCDAISKWKTLLTVRMAYFTCRLRSKVMHDRLIRQLNVFSVYVSVSEWDGLSASDSPVASSPVRLYVCLCAFVMWWWSLPVVIAVILY